MREKSSEISHGYEPKDLIMENEMGKPLDWTSCIVLWKYNLEVQLEAIAKVVSIKSQNFSQIAIKTHNCLKWVFSFKIRSN